PLAAMATPATDAKLATRATAGGLSVKQARELAASHRGVTDEADARRFEHRSFRFNDTNLSIWAAMTKDDYATTKALLMAGVSLHSSDAGPAADADQGDVSLTGSQPNEYVPFNQRLYDSFMDVVNGGRSTTKGNWYRPTMVVHADLQYLVESDFEDSSDDSGADIQGLGPISRQVARRLACDAAIVFSVEGHDGCILDQKRVRRSPTEAQRREIARRDKGCRFPGCSFTDFTQVHHVKLWTDGGETNQDNLLTLCGRHHRAVHELGWKVIGNCDEMITFTGPHGHSMTSGPSPTWPPTARKGTSSPVSSPANGSAPLRR
ncbi:MAG TPA: HNH endonuclease signature motif containing protein, partial [Acidimicrobiales bacterium]